MSTSSPSGTREAKVNGNIASWYKFTIKNHLNALKIFLQFNLSNITGTYSKICSEDQEDMVTI